MNMQCDIQIKCSSCNQPFGRNQSYPYRCSQCQCIIHSFECFKDFYMKRRWNGGKLYYVVCSVCHMHQLWASCHREVQEIREASLLEKQSRMDSIKEDHSY